MIIEDHARDYIDRFELGDTAYAVLLSLLRSYGDERARARKNQAEQAVNETRYPQGADTDEWRTAMLMRDYCADSVRSLS